MDNFDTQWDNFDIDSLDIDTASKKTTVKPTVADKKAKAIIDKREIDQNIDLDYDKFLDYDSQIFSHSRFSNLRKRPGNKRNNLLSLEWLQGGRRV